VYIRHALIIASRNCAFMQAAHPAMLAPETAHVAVPPSTEPAPGIDVLPRLLLPLAGPEEFDIDVRSRSLLLTIPR
jgi:hypothetical protein